MIIHHDINEIVQRCTNDEQLLIELKQYFIKNNSIETHDYNAWSIYSFLKSKHI